MSTALLYNNYRTRQLNGNAVNYSSDTIKVALLTASYTPDYTNHKFYSDLTNEVVGTGYSAGGVALSGVTVTEDDVTPKSYISASNPSWASSTITARYVAVYKSTGTGSTSALIGLIDLGGNKSTNGDTFLLSIPSGILLTLS